MKKATFVLLYAMIFAGISIFAERPSQATQQSTSPASKLTKRQEQAQTDVKLGDVAFKNHATHEAIADYKAAIEADPSDPRTHRKFIQMGIYNFYLSRVMQKNSKQAKNHKRLTKEQEQAQKVKAEGRTEAG